MTEDEQKHIFSKNLNYYITLSGKQQKEVAKDLGISPTTFNSWCVGKIFPRLSKIQLLADYFHIGKSDLIDDKLDSDASFDAKILTDIDTLDMIKKYYSLSIEDKKVIRQLIDSLYRKTEL